MTRAQASRWYEKWHNWILWLLTVIGLSVNVGYVPVRIGRTLERYDGIKRQVDENKGDITENRKKINKICNRMSAYHGEAIE